MHISSLFSLDQFLTHKTFHQETDKENMKLRTFRSAPDY